LKSIRRGVLTLIAVALLPAPRVQSQEPAQPAPSPGTTTTPVAQSAATPVPSSFEITGEARSGKTPLPGATVTASNTLTGKKYAAITGTNGKFTFSRVPRGRYVVRIEFMGFALFTKEFVLNPENPSAKVDAELILASRQQEQTNNAAAGIAAGRGFQSLALDSTLSALAGDNSGFASTGSGGGGQNNSDLSVLPLNGAGVDVSTESVSISGAQGRAQDFGNGSEEDLQGRIQEFRDRVQTQGGSNAFGSIPGFGAPGGGGQGGFGGGPGGGGIAIGRIGGRGLNVNQPHGTLYFSDDNSSLDATPFSLTGIPSFKSQYNQARFGANVGGPLNIPKIFNGGNKWYFFAGWNGSRGETPYDAFSRVPTLAERNGDFSGATYNDGTPVELFNPVNGTQYQYNGVLNQLNPALISPSAKALLQYIPLPNIPTTDTGQNFHYITSDASNSDAVILRLIHNFGSPPAPSPGGRGGGGGGGRGRRQQNNINFGLNWSRTSTNIVGPFPSLAGGTGTQGLNATAGWVYGKNRFTNNLRFGYNHNHISTTNL
jgi:hypothetical protein